jgi:hypothetical protein
VNWKNQQQADSFAGQLPHRGRGGVDSGEADTQVLVSLTRHTDRAPGEQRLELSDPGRVLS